MTTGAMLARLRHAVSQNKPAPPPERVGPDAEALRAILRVEEQVTPAGTVYLRDDWYAPSHEHGALPIDAPLRAEPRALAAILGATESPPAHRLAYFDIETTGLAGGTGTYAVVAGLGSFEADGFRLRQYFLADIGQERAMLAALAGELARFAGLVTYNGRSFDVPCIEGRFTLARVPSPCRELAHIDLLHAVRRLYGHRMSACRLADAERRLLRIERFDDLPGSLIPQMYFDYARAGRVAPLRAVLRHNAEDVLSLAGILARVARMLDSDELAPEDAVAVARWCERSGDEGRAMRLYGGALGWLAGSRDWAWASARQARLCRRAGRREEAVALWEALWREGDAAAGLELAKHHEHHGRDFEAAAAITAGLLEGGSAGVGPSLAREALEHRLARIRVKAARG
jgi:uncharacterized protein YprB with RNaseH-like and TPR domain